MPTIDPLGSVAHRIPVDVLRIQPDAIGDRPYLVDDENGELSFGQVDDIAGWHAVGHADLGLGKGDTAAIFMANSTTLAATTFGINRLGAIWSPVSTEYRGEWLRELLTADDTNQQDPEVRPAREWRGAGNVGPDDARGQLAAHQTHRKMDGYRVSTGIDVGVYFDLRNPQQWRQNPSHLYGFTLEACEEAERLGASSLWFSEHHLFDDDYLASPLTFAAAVAARTSRARLGTAIVIAPLHHPAELAEQSVIVDLVSDGRLDLGLGAGYRIPEFDLYEASIKTRYRDTDATARELRKLWAPDGVRPGPAQAEIPIWMGYQGPKGARRAGLLGERVLSADAELWEPYSQGLIEAGHPVERGRMAGGIQAWVSDDPDQDWPLVSKHLRHQLDSYRAHMVEGTGRPTPRPVDLDRIVNVDRPGPLGSFHYGTPEFVAEAIRKSTAGAPVETVFLWASIGGMPEDVVMRNIETVCTKLAPLLASTRD